MYDELPESDIYLRLNLGFQAIRVINNQFLPNVWDFTVDIVPNNSLDVGSDSVRGSLRKMKYWIEEIMNGSLIFSNENKWALDFLFRKSGKQAPRNNLVLLPGLITDDIIARVIHSKLTAFAGDSLILGALEISSEDDFGLSVFYTGENNLIPDSDEWIGKRSFFDKPWWQRDDSSTIDVTPSANDDITIVPAYAVSLDFLNHKPRVKRRKKAELIRPNFKPYIIKGSL